nr:unnamed protein product [Amyelois transitella]
MVKAELAKYTKKEPLVTVNDGWSIDQKCPKDRLSPEYIEIRLDNLERDWLLFRDNDNKLYNIPELSEFVNTEYVKNESAPALKDLLDTTTDCLSALEQERDLTKQPVESVNLSTSTNQITSCISTAKVIKTKQVLLATALLKAQTKTGEFQLIRALIDQGSQASFITESAVQFLRLKKIPVKGIISCLGNSKTVNATHMVITNIQSRIDPHFVIQIHAYVLNNITSYLPETKVESLDWLDIKGINLADPQFNTPNRIDMLLGADIFSCILKEGMRKNPIGNLVAQSTSLGWILSGVVETTGKCKPVNISISSMHVRVNDDEILKKFWEIEEQQPRLSKLPTEEEQRCEEFFRATTTRTELGRYVVSLPFKTEEPFCTGGNSRHIAIKRLEALEKKLDKDNDLKNKYIEVINEYLKLDHMRPVKETDDMTEFAVYLPHHAVVRNDKSTSKVRVVFNASSPNNKGVSLNDTLMVGPTLQADLRHIIMRWRLHPIALVADIIKMYRQVRINENDAIYQRIVWRNKPEDEIKDYELVTVTFGTASAPFLAVRAMHQLAYDEGKHYPIAADNVLNNFYMDDLMSGCSTVQDGIELYTQLTQLLKKGGFQLQKWKSNDKDLQKQIEKCEAEEKREWKENENVDTSTSDDIHITLDDTIKILGLTWNCDKDYFRYLVHLPALSGPATKRSVLSDIARLFDPLGWIAPAVILAKIFIQKLWLSGIGWDEVLSTKLLKEWETYREELQQVSKVHIPRWVGTATDSSNVELHGFCDASKLAYAAVIYIRVLDSTGNVNTSLLVAKTRVAPVKQVSIPRLELCGAVLLAKLLYEATEVLHIEKSKVKAWTDSTIVLSWLNSHPSRWKTFVANRVSEILNLIDSSHWHHVSSKDNPADCASRGVQPALLSECMLWISGPSFLQNRASKELVKLRNIQQSIASLVETNGTEWHYIPPHAPNFGGLWESAVKSTKYHLKRILGDSTLTFEEMKRYY